VTPGTINAMEEPQSDHDGEGLVLRNLENTGGLSSADPWAPGLTRGRNRLVMKAGNAQEGRNASSTADTFVNKVVAVKQSTISSKPWENSPSRLSHVSEYDHRNYMVL